MSQRAPWIPLKALTRYNFLRPQGPEMRKDNCNSTFDITLSIKVTYKLYVLVLLFIQSTHSHHMITQLQLAKLNCLICIPNGRVDHLWENDGGNPSHSPSCSRNKDGTFFRTHPTPLHGLHWQMNTLAVCDEEWPECKAWLCILQFQSWPRPSLTFLPAEGEPSPPWWHQKESFVCLLCKEKYIIYKKHSKGKTRYLRRFDIKRAIIKKEGQDEDEDHNLLHLQPSWAKLS